MNVITWFKVDDTLAFHHKVVAAGNAAMGLWVRAGALSAQQLTDGFIPEHMVLAMGSLSQANKLVDVSLWERVEGGFRFHEWNENGRQPTREHVENERAAARERMANRRKRSEDVRANNAGTSDAVREPRPDPTRPVKEKASSDASPKRGKRIPDDFHVTPEMVEWARTNTPGVDGRSETEKFIDYWRAKAGRDGVKLDWVGTWRNWMRTAGERAPRPTGPTSINRPGYVMAEPPRDIVDDPDAVAAFHRANRDAWNAQASA